MPSLVALLLRSILFSVCLLHVSERDYLNLVWRCYIIADIRWHLYIIDHCQFLHHRAVPFPCVAFVSSLPRTLNTFLFIARVNSCCCSANEIHAVDSTD